MQVYHLTSLLIDRRRYLIPDSGDQQQLVGPDSLHWCFLAARQGSFGSRQQEVVIPRRSRGASNATAPPVAAPVVGGNRTTAAAPALSLQSFLTSIRRRRLAGGAPLAKTVAAAGVAAAADTLTDGLRSFQALLVTPSADGGRRSPAAVFLHAMSRTPDEYKGCALRW